MSEQCIEVNKVMSRILLNSMKLGLLDASLDCVAFKYVVVVMYLHASQGEFKCRLLAH